LHVEAIALPAVTLDTIDNRVSIVIPVYRGEKTLPVILGQLAELVSTQSTHAGHNFTLCEVILIHDCGPDRSDLTIEHLCQSFPFVRAVWLSKNYGQHAATLAGMASASGRWVVTMDEDGQQDPQSIADMLDLALKDSLQLVYAHPINPPPHGMIRNGLSRLAKKLSSGLLGNKSLGNFNSFRLVDGEIARNLAAYCGSGVFLDVGLFWITGRVGHCPVRLREELGRPSGYSYLKLVGHFWHLVVTTGTRPLRLITIMGALSIVLALIIGCYVVYAKAVGLVPVEGWASTLIVVTFFSGSILTALGVIAEYLAVTMGIAMGKPLYVVSTRPTRPRTTT
jgi:polyisoprenyl-phosphate glycosyltransferase